MTPPGDRTIIGFLQQFTQNPGQVHQFKQNPHKMARDFGLDDQQAEVVASFDAVRINEAIVAEGGYPSPCILVVFG